MFSTKSVVHDSALIIRELAKTADCDKMVDFMSERNFFREDIDDDSYGRVIGQTGSLNDHDKFRASAAIWHYQYWMRTKL